MKTPGFMTFFLIAQLCFALVGGGQDGSGGGAAFDSQTGQNKILDLLEIEDLVPVKLDPRKQYASEIFNEILSPYRTTYPAYGFLLKLYYSLVHSANLHIDGEYRWYLDSYYNQEIIQKMKIDPSFRALKFFFTETPLENVQDEGMISLDGPYEKVQVAIQKKGNVVINSDQFNKMDDLNKTALLLHEYILHVVLTYNPDLIKTQGTKPVRTFVRRLILHAQGKLGTGPKIEPGWVLESAKALGID